MVCVCVSFLIGFHGKRIGGERTVGHHQHVLRASIFNDTVSLVKVAHCCFTIEWSKENMRGGV